MTKRKNEGSGIIGSNIPKSAQKKVNRVEHNVNDFTFAVIDGADTRKLYDTKKKPRNFNNILDK